MTCKEFAEKHNVSIQAVDYAIKKGLIDAEQNGRRWAIIDTMKTKGYRPVMRKGKRG
jgi:Zn-dependent peptidase ImmA (M78 family)